MNKLKRFAVLFAAVLLLITVANYFPKSAAASTLVVPKVQFATQPKTVYQAGDIVKFDLKAPNYGGRVQYRVVLWHDEVKSYRDLWPTGDRYYTNWKPYGNELFNLHWLINEPGHYRITIYAKRSGVPNNKTALKGMNCDSYMAGIPFVVNPKGVTIGATISDVKSNLGQPIDAKIDDDLYIMEYKDVALFFDRTSSPNSVVGWSNNGNTKVSLGDRISSAAPFKIGSTSNDVIMSMGSPKYIPPYYLDNNIDYWVYNDDSMVFFDGNSKVIGYINNGSLKVSLGTKLAANPSIGFTSKSTDIISSMGTPEAVNAFVIEGAEGTDYGYILDVDYFAPEKLYNVGLISDEYTYYEYGDSYIMLNSSGYLDTFINVGNLKMNFGSIDSNFSGTKMGSTWDEIVKANGTPDAIIAAEDFPKLWVYGQSVFTTDDNGKVLGWSTTGNLNVAKEYSTPTMTPVTIGLTRDELAKAIGLPSEYFLDNWKYGNSVILFDGDRIEEIDNVDKNILLSLSELDPSNQGFSIGSSIDELSKAMGAPDKVVKYNNDFIYWSYGASKVYLDVNGKVVSFDNSGNLKMIGDTNYDTSAAPIKLGSTKDEVIIAMGIPTKMPLPDSTESKWWYGLSSITFDKDNKVVGWDNAADNLKVSIGDKDAEAPAFWLGSTVDDVVKAMGTPKVLWIDELNFMYFSYDKGFVMFDNNTGLVNGWDKASLLKLETHTPDPTAQIPIPGFTTDDILKLKGTPDSIFYDVSEGKLQYLLWFYGTSYYQFPVDTVN